MMVKNISRFLVVMFLGLSVLNGTANADSSGYDGHMKNGMALYSEKQYKEAANEFTEALNENPGSQEATTRLGAALSRIKDSEAEHYLKKALMLNAGDPYVNFELGLLYFDKGIYSEAMDYFTNCIQLGQTTEYAGQASEYIKKIESSKNAKPYYANVSLGQQYDSNVVLTPDGIPLTKGLASKSDFKTLLFLDARYKFIDSGAIEASAGYNFNQAFNYRLSSFNVTRNLADLYMMANVSPVVGLGAQYKLEYILLGGHGYDFANSAGPIAVFKENDKTSTELRYIYKYSTFTNGGLFLNNSDRTGSNNSLSISQTFRLGGTDTLPVSIDAGYSYDKDEAGVDYWRYSGNKGLANVTVSLPALTYVNLYGEYYGKRYDGNNPLSGGTRIDGVQTYSLSGTKLFGQHNGDAFALTLGLTCILNKSNINVYDYKRYLSSLLFTVRF